MSSKNLPQAAITNTAIIEPLKILKRHDEAIEVLQQASIICDDEAVKEKLWLAIGILNGAIEE